MKHRFFFILALPLALGAFDHGLKDYFPRSKQVSYHFYSPNYERPDPMTGQPIPPRVASSFGLPPFEPYPESIEWYGLMRLKIGKGLTGYIVRGPGTYDSSVIGLYFFDRSSHSLKEAMILADSWGDDDYAYEKNSWLMDLNGDGFLDIVSKEIEYHMGMDEGETETVEKRTEGFLYKDGLFIPYKGDLSIAASFKLKDNPNL